jgi:hypothetical protein
VCGQTKPQGEFFFNEWRKGKKQQLCLDCSHCHNATPPQVVEAIKLDAFSSTVLGESASNENGLPNFLSLWKRKSTSPCGLRERTLAPSMSPPSLLQLACSTAPSKKCRGVYKGYLGSAIAFAAKAYQHTAQQLGEMARDPNASVRRFTKSALARSWDLCLPLCGVLVSRSDNTSNGFVFRSLSCSGDCRPGICCSYCSPWNQIKEIRQSIESDVHWCTGNRAMIQNIAYNPILAATKICMLREEVRSLCS